MRKINMKVFVVKFSSPTMPHRSGLTLLIGYCPLLLRWVFIYSWLFASNEYRTNRPELKPHPMKKKKSISTTHHTSLSNYRHAYQSAKTNPWHSKRANFIAFIFEWQPKFMDQSYVMLVNQLVFFSVFVPLYFSNILSLDCFVMR